ncbi:MAG: phosphotransferase family protein [Acidimicrobiales bacterium]
MDPDLAGWVARSLGGTITSARRTATGGSRTTYLVDVVRDTHAMPVVVRVEGEGSFTGTELSLAREAVAYRALAGTPVPVPAVLASSEDGSALILERLPGTDDLSTLDAVDRDSVFAHFVTVLADLHAIDPDDLDLPGFARPRAAEDHARLDIEMWQRLAAGVDDLDPLLAYAGAWLHAHPPPVVRRTCFVQGDTGPGNFLASDGRVTGLVDMEFAHIGDPVDDVAWVLTRLAGGIADPDTFLAAYEERSGIIIDRASLAYYELAVQYRCAVTTSLAVGRGGGARGWAPYLLVTQRYLAGIARGLSSLAGVTDPEVYEPVSAETPRSRMFDRLLEDVRVAVRAIGDEDVRAATRDAQILVHYLRANDRYGAAVEVADATDRRALLGHAGDEPAGLLAAAERAGAAGDLDMLAYLLRRRRRMAILWRTLLDRPRR